MPAPVVIGTIALSQAAKTIPVWVSLAVTAGMTALSIGYKFLTQPKGIRGLSKRDWDSNVVSTEQHLPVVYGKARIGLSPIFASSGEDAKGGKYDNLDWLFVVSALCHGEIESIERLILNNEDKNAILARNEDGDLEPDEFYQGFVHFGWRPGKNSGVKPYKEIQIAFPKWSDNHLGQGVASIYLNLRYNQEKFPSGVPNVTAVIKGIKVHDPRNVLYPNDTIAYSSNPALCVLDYLKSTTYGIGAEDTEIDLNSFIVAANYCDQLLSSSLIDAPPAPSAKLIDTSTNLYTGASQEYTYGYAFGSLSVIDEYTQSTWSGLGPLVTTTCTVTKAYGAVRLSGIDNHATYSRVIFRKELSTSTYKYIGQIDPDDTTTIFDDNVIEADLGEAHSIAGSPGTPGAFTATFRDFTTAALDASSYYRYKVTYETATGTHTEASNASNKVKTKANKKAIKVTIPISEDAKVTARKIYRTSGYASGNIPASTDYKLLATISNNTQETYIDLLADPTGASAPSTSDATSSQIKMFTCNGILDTSRDVMTNLEELLSSCRGKLFYESGKYTIAIRTTAVPEVFELNEDNIIGDWNYRTPGTKDVCNILKASWVNPDQNWQTDYVIWPHGADNNLYLGDDYGFKISKEIDLPFTTSKRTARQIAQVVRKETRQGILVTLTAKEEALKLKANSLVKVTHTSPSWTDKLFWVDAIKILPNDTVGLALTEYDATVYNYEIINADTLGGADTTLPDPNDPPDEVTSVVITEEMYGLTPSQISLGQSAASPMPNWRIKITYTNPSSNFWHHSDVYVKKGSNSDYIQMGMIDKNSNGVFYLFPVEPFVTYYIKFVSVSDFGPRMLVDDATEYSYTITPAKPNNASNLSAVNKGNDVTAEGEDFVITWAGVTNVGSGTSDNSVSASIPKIAEEISYDVEVYLTKSFITYGVTYTGIADSVLLNNGKKLNSQLMGTYNTTNTTFTYTKEMNISDINKIFENQTTNTNYENYYGHSQRTLRFIVYTKNTWGKRSSGSIIYLHNPAPTMTDIDGNTITPTHKAGLSSLEFSWEQPFNEIDLTHFMSKLIGKATNDLDYDSATLDILLNSTSKRKSSTAYAVGDYVFPKPANGHLYKCLSVVGDGKTASTQPVFAKPSDSNGAHPTTTDGNVTWKHYCILRFQKVTASTNSSEDDDMAATNYTVKFQNIDPKKSFRFKVTAHDAHGAGTSSNMVTAISGTTHDITEDEDISKPDQVGGVAITINSNNNVVIKWNAPATTSDKLDVTEAIIDWRARQGVTGTPTLTLRTAGGDIPTLVDIDNGYYGADTSTLVIGEKKIIKLNIDEDEIYTKNQTVIKNAKTGYTYFVRIRFKNSSSKEGDWSAWAYNATAVTGLSEDDMPSKWSMYKFTGSVTAYNATQITWVGGTGVLKKKTNSGSTDITINTQATPQTITPNATMFLCYTGSANLALKTEAQLDADATFVAIAKCTTAPSGKCKVLMMVSAEHFRISAYEAGFNLLSAVTADLGEITAGTVTGATIQTGTGNAKVIIDSSGLRAYNSSGTQRVQISNDGSGWLGASGNFSWDTSGNITATGVTAGSVAAENIVAGTITGSTLQTASSGKRFVVTTSTNEAEFYGDRGDTTVEKLCTIGINSGGGDQVILNMGHSSSNSRVCVYASSVSTGYTARFVNTSTGQAGYFENTSTGRGINVLSTSDNAIYATSTTGTTINAVASTSGTAIHGASSSGYGVICSGNATKSPLRVVPIDYTTKPTTAVAGDIIFDSSINKHMGYNGATWNAFW